MLHVVKIDTQSNTSFPIQLELFYEGSHILNWSHKQSHLNASFVYSCFRSMRTVGDLALAGLGRGQAAVSISRRVGPFEKVTYLTAFAGAHEYRRALRDVHHCTAVGGSNAIGLRFDSAVLFLISPLGFPSLEAIVLRLLGRKLFHLMIENVTPSDLPFYIPL